MDEEAFAKATENTHRQFDAQARQVSNGFALTGTIRYVDNKTNTVRVAYNSEAIATNGEAAAESLKNFLTTGSFDA